MNDLEQMAIDRLKAKRVVNPIIDWTGKDVYGFLEDAKAPDEPAIRRGAMPCRLYRLPYGGHEMA